MGIQTLPTVNTTRWLYLGNFFGSRRVDSYVQRLAVDSVVTFPVHIVLSKRLIAEVTLHTEIYDQSPIKIYR